VKRHIGFEALLVLLSTAFLGQSLDLVVGFLHRTVADWMVKEVEDPLDGLLGYAGDLLDPVSATSGKAGGLK
jgi:hypothetical protein